MKRHVLPGLTELVCGSMCPLKSMEVTHSPICREVLIVSLVSILNDSVLRKVFKVLRSRIGLQPEIS